MHKNGIKRRSIVVEQNRYLEAYNGPKSLFTYESCNRAQNITGRLSASPQH